jgi:aminoglycoside phosphotransferase (APT) family kinase protein
MHGDFHFGNIMFERSSGEVAAVVDWELATVGDPAVDLGWLLATWADPDGSHPGCIPVSPWRDFATEAELVERYCGLTGVNPSVINWFVVLACFKLGIIQEGSFARAAAGQADRATAKWMHAASIRLFERALSRI